MPIGLLRKQILKILAELGDGCLSVFEKDQCLLRADDEGGTCLYINDTRAYAAFAGGSVAAAESYVNGWWHASDLYALMRLAARNLDVLNAGMDGGWRRLVRALTAMTAGGRRRLLAKESAREDIAAHYDLGNEFFSLFLDETLAYSCAVFGDLTTAGADNLLQASRCKLNKICDKLELTEKDRLLDLGCGWGSMAFHAAAHCRCPVTAVTLSAAQHDYVQRQPLAQQGAVCTWRGDYRDFVPQQKFSKLSSVEMIEAVGERHFRTYFERIRAVMADGGLAQVQAILIPDVRYRAARRDDDFIRRHIFPGGMLPSLAVICQAADAACLRLLALEDIGEHYAPTLLAWRQRFNRHKQRIKALGFDARFCRLWEYYFCYCAGAFAEGALSVAQLVFSPKRVGLL